MNIIVYSKVYSILYQCNLDNISIQISTEYFTRRIKDSKAYCELPILDERFRLPTDSLASNEKFELILWNKFSFYVVSNNYNLDVKLDFILKLYPWICRHVSKLCCFSWTSSRKIRTLSEEKTHQSFLAIMFPMCNLHKI